MNAPIEPCPEPWRQHLAALPSVDPPDALWARLQHLAVAPKRSRPVWPWAAAAAVMAAVLAWPRPEVPVAQPTASAPSVDQNLRLLDQELTLAYARQADEAELAVLWQTRERLLQGAGEADQPLLVRL
jgi:hypothetical protein